MAFSTRNILIGTVTSVNKGAVNADITLNLHDGSPVNVILGNSSVDDLDLKEGGEVFAIIKATNIGIGTNLLDAKANAGNILCGAVSKVVEGPISTEVDLDIGHSNTLTASITTESAKRLGLRAGTLACAMFNASSVILGVKDKHWGLRQETISEV